MHAVERSKPAKFISVILFYASFLLKLFSQLCVSRDDTMYLYIC